MNVNFDILSTIAGAAIIGIPMGFALVIQKKAIESRTLALNETIAALKTDLLNTRETCSREIESIKEYSSHQMEALINSSANEIKDVKDACAREVDAARKEMSIEAYPFEQLAGSDGFLVDDRHAEIGYQFQLFIRGVPCFEPHKVVTKRINKKEVNPEKIKFLRSEVVGLLESIANRHPAFNLAGKILKQK